MEWSSKLNSVESVPLSQASMAMAEHGIATRPAAFLLSSHRYLQEQRTGKWAFQWVWRDGACSQLQQNSDYIILIHIVSIV